MLSVKEIEERVKAYQQLAPRLQKLVDGKVLEQYPEIRRKMSKDAALDIDLSDEFLS